MDLTLFLLRQADPKIVMNACQIVYDFKAFLQSNMHHNNGIAQSDAMVDQARPNQAMDQA